MSLLKYIQIAKNTLQEYFTYRVNFFFWRLQVFFSFIIYYSLWFAVSSSQGGIASYTASSIYTYFVLGYLVRTLVFSTRTADIGGDIQNGNLSTLILKPLSPVKYYFARDTIDKLFNLIFMSFEFLLIIFLYKPQLIFPNPSSLLFFILLILFATISFFFYSLIISFITFWVDEAWSTRFLFGVVFVNLFSGQIIPLDLLPHWIQNILNFTPYPYFFFYPIKVWLNQLPISQYPSLLLSYLVLILVTYSISSFMWQKGKVKYQSYGQ